MAGVACEQTAVDRPTPGGHRARPRAADATADGCPERRRDQACYGAGPVGRTDPIFDRLSALAVRGRRRLPDGLSDPTIRKIRIDNPLETYPRLRAFYGPAESSPESQCSRSQGDDAMNKPVADREVNAAQKLSFVDCDIHPVQLKMPEGLASLSFGAMARAQRNFWHSSLPGPDRSTAVSADDGCRHARRRVSFQWRSARQRSRT